MASLQRMARMLAQLESERIGRPEAVREGTRAGAAAISDRKQSGFPKRTGSEAAQRKPGKCR